MKFMADLLDPTSLLPHGVCFQLRPDLIWLHVASDAVIALSYFLIPAALIWFTRHRTRRLSFDWMLKLFAAFIVLCGISHVLEIVTIWNPLYYLQGYEKAATAAVSLMTALSIVPLVPKLLALRSPEELAEANERLRSEIRAREAAERELRHSLQATRQAVQELEQFTYITSHDLQGPLRTMSGFSQLLLHRYRPKLDGDAAEFIEYIDKGSRQMQALIRDLLELTRVGRASTGFDLQPLGTALGRALHALQEPIERSRAQIHSGDLPEIVANHVLIAQLLQNLIGNAIKFSRPGEVPRIEISAMRVADEWNLVVADHGIGIPADQLQNVFAIFRRLHAAEAYEGTGIGLAICRKVARFHGGDISVSSDDTGTRFLVRLPVTPGIHPLQVPAAGPVA